MNRIAFNLRSIRRSRDESDTERHFVLDVCVDDRDFLDYVREIEGPFAAAEGHPDIAGGYESPPADMALENLSTTQAEKISLYDCECGCPGCWPLLFRISMTEEIVIWSEFEQPHRGSESGASWWRYDELGPFKFERKQYLAALQKVESEFRDQQ